MSLLPFQLTIVQHRFINVIDQEDLGAMLLKRFKWGSSFYTLNRYMPNLKDLKSNTPIM